MFVAKRPINGHCAFSLYTLDFALTYVIAFLALAVKAIPTREHEWHMRLVIESCLGVLELHRTAVLNI